MKKHIHIDTLYLSYNVLHEHEYLHHLQELIDVGEGLGNSGGRSWFRLKSGVRIGVINSYEISELSKNYHFHIQYPHDLIFDIDPYQLKDNIPLPFSKDQSRYKVNRMDYNITIENSNNLLEKIYKSRHFRRLTKIQSGHKVETIYLGRRSTGKVFRIYDKTKELNDNKSYIKYDSLLQFFGTTSNLVTIELELRRDYIRDRLDLEQKGTLAELNMIVTDARHILQTIELCDDTQQNRFLMSQNHYNRIDFIKLLDYIDDGSVLSLPVKRYEPSITNLVCRINDLVSAYSDKTDDIINLERVIKILSDQNLKE